MRPLGLLLALAACTVENPAFHVTASEGGTASDSADPTQPQTTAPVHTSTESTASTEPPTTSLGPTTTTTTTTDTATSGATDETSTTDGTATTTTTSGVTATTDVMTASSVTSETDTGPDVCGGNIDDQLGPLVPLLTAQGHQPVDFIECTELADMPLVGRVVVANGGFDILKDFGCQGTTKIPAEGIHIPVPLPLMPDVNQACVGLRYTIHPEYFDCYLSGITVTHAGKPVFWGSFGVAPFAKNSLDVSYQPLGQCDPCPGCCGDGPDPDRYTFQPPQMPPVQEGDSLTFFIQGHKFQFNNLRSHIHSPDCLTSDLPRAEWLHFDWMAFRVP